MDAFQLLAVASDIHMGGREVQIFRSGDLLAAGIDALRLERPDEHVGLVLNGDVVDFLAEPGAKAFAPFEAAGHLARIIDDGAFSPVFAALARFVQTERRTVAVVLGNHDVEMALEDVQTVLLRRLSSSDEKNWRTMPIRDEVRGRVRFATRGTGYRCAVGGKSVWCLHGDMADGWNAVDHSGLGRAQHDIARGLPPRAPATPPGTQLVVEHLNRVKARYPLADLLKPEVEVAIELLRSLDGDLNRKIPAAAALLVKAKARAYAGTEYLSAEGETEIRLPPVRGSLPSAEELARWSEANLDRRPLDLLEGTRADETLALPVIGEARTRIQGRVSRDRSWRLEEEDEPYAWIEKHQVRADLVVAGHTHLRRLIRRPNGSWYANSGTWIALVRLTPEHFSDSEAFEALCRWARQSPIAALEGEVPGLGTLVRPRPTWVRVEDAGGGVQVSLVDATGDDEGLPDDERPSRLQAGRL